MSDWLDYLLTLHSKDIDLGLERVGEVAKSLDVLRPAPFVITISGTNGKGSSLAFLSSILQAAGLKVGAYTSPHLLKFNERIQINSVPLDDVSICESFSRINQARGEDNLTFFEFTTLAALDIFSRADLDVVLLEVGLGGRLDAVNIVDADAALITALDLDHKDWLGDDLEQIGWEKSGIMRSGKLAVCSAANPPDSIARCATNIGAKLLLLGRDFSYKSQESSWDFILNNKVFAQLPLPSLAGDFQLQNAAGVLALVLSQNELQVGVVSVKQGLQKACHSGRLQKLKALERDWLLDVAHNPQAAKVLAGYLAQHGFAKKRLTAVFAALDDKDVSSIVALIKPFIANWILVDLNEDRALSTDDLLQVLLDQGVVQEEIVTLSKMDELVQLSGLNLEKNLVVFGSFVTVAQAMELLNNG